jgi:RNA polymerase sigma factor (sigma-70 family)
VTRAKRNRLIEENLDLTRVIARSVGSKLPPYVDLREELLSEARTLLVEAAHKYDASRGLTFRHWCRWFVNKRIYDFIRRKNLREARHTHLEDIAETDKAGTSCSFTDPAANSGMDHIEELAVPPVQESAAEAALLRSRVAELPAPQRQLIELHYHGQETLHQVRIQMNASRSEVLKLHDEALRSLRMRMAA